MHGFINHRAHPCLADNCLLIQVSTGHLQLLSINQSTTGLQVNNHLNPPSTGQTLYLHIGLLHPSGKGNLVNNHHRPSTGPINHPIPGQQQSTSQQNYTAGRQNYNRVIDNQQHQQPSSTDTTIYQQSRGTAHSGYYGVAPHLPVYQQPQQQQQLYNNQPLPQQQQQLYSNQQRAQLQDQRSISSFSSCSNSDSDSSSTTSGVVYRRSRHRSRSNKTHSRHSTSSRHVSPVEEEVSDHPSPHHKSSGKKHVNRKSDRHGQSDTDGHHTSSNRHRAKPAPMKQDKKFFFSVPKNLKYTGKGNWKAFYTKFTGYAEAAGWTDKQKREQLCWCLEDKASDFYTVLLESNKDIAFSAVVAKMVKRFGFQEPQETSQIQFQTITQKKEESLEDWADRVLSLATQSFKDLSEEYMTKQAVMKFCQGCNDPEAGQHACGFKPVSVENAIDIIKWFQHSRKAVQAHIAQGKTPEVKQASAPTPTAPVSDTPSVHGVGSSKSAIDTRVSQMEQQLRQQREEQQQSMQQMQSLLSSMATLTEEMRQSNRSSGTSPSRDYRSDNTSRGRGQGRRGGYNNRAGKRRTQTPDGACFYCHEQGHFKRDCPKLNNSPGSKPPTQNKQTERKSVTMNVPEDQVTERPSNGFTVVGTIGTAQLLRVQVQIQDKLVTALIDTGSEVTIMQDKVFDSLKEKPYVIKETLMHGAGREMQMTCRITNPTLFRIQDLLFNHHLYIAPIDCEMLLGHDFLASNNVILNIGQGYMSINDKTVKLVLGGETPSAQPSVSRITIPNSVVVPPNSVMRMNCTVPVQDNDFVIEPNSKTTLLIPRSVCAKGQSPVVCFMNVTDNPVRLQGGIEVAEAHAVTVIESMDDPQELSVGTCSTSKQDNSQKDEAVPLARKRKQKPRLLKRVATAIMKLFETPGKVSTLEQPAVPVESAVMKDCCRTSSLNSIEPIASQSSEECDLPHSVQVWN
ncbi:unnamed protein product [Mytilus edulis]|uniref:CCHC-type domain-containing protein n=1 Tax=Mytilus edulis TaxID=6550 RepID=A0A8S3TSH4_MYTED|nr:unnamed protein product [Mytilus edulis]